MSACVAVDSAKRVEGKPLDERINEPLKKSIEELDALLPEGWRKKSGLQFETANDGTSEWVRPEDVERFKREGKALLGREGGASKEEEEAHETARQQMNALKKQQAKLSVTSGAPPAAAMGRSVTETSDIPERAAEMKAAVSEARAATEASDMPDLVAEMKEMKAEMKAEMNAMRKELRLRETNKSSACTIT